MRKTVLVVEDSESSRDVISHFLQQGGFRVLEAQDGAEALGILKQRQVDLILTDIMMPNMDGWTFYKEVRKEKRFNLTPFVFLTVLDDLEAQIKGLGLGVDDYIIKPVNAPQLLARVNTTLTRGERMGDYFFLNPVTDLQTPTYFRHRIVQETRRCRHFDRPLCLVMVDIGNYVALARGHADWFAQAAAMETGLELRRQLRDFDLLADMRQGRFAILMPESTEQEAKNWAEQLRAGWKIAPVWPETEQKIPVDVGFTVDVLSPGEGDTITLLDKRLESFVRKW